MLRPIGRRRPYSTSVPIAVGGAAPSSKPVGLVLVRARAAAASGLKTPFAVRWIRPLLGVTSLSGFVIGTRATEGDGVTLLGCPDPGQSSLGELDARLGGGAG